MTDLHQQDQIEQSLIDSNVESIDPVLLAKLLLDKQESEQGKIH